MEKIHDFLSKTIGTRMTYAEADAMRTRIERYDIARGYSIPNAFFVKGWSEEFGILYKMIHEGQRAELLGWWMTPEYSDVEGVLQMLGQISDYREKEFRNFLNHNHI